MKKILIAFDGKNFSQGAFEFAKKLNEKNSILLTGVFLSEFVYESLWAYSFGMGGTYIMPTIERVNKTESEIIVKQFETACQLNQIAYRVHEDYSGFSLEMLVKESRYADILVLGSEAFYKYLGTDEPNDFLKKVLREVECPVLIVPEILYFPKNIILAYDGSASSVYAIKQFSYVLSELCSCKALLVYANEDTTEDIPDSMQVQELLSRHFADLNIYRMALNAKEYFASWATEERTSLLVSGSYGRSGFSEYFKKSFVKEIIAKHKIPVFISHH